jgi:two-component system OmpR family sensor kinase
MPTSTRLYWYWLAFATGCTVLMWSFPGGETIPYHLGYITLAAAYGLEPWPRSRAMWSITAFTFVTGAIIVQRAATDVLGWGETAEIPLMATLMALMVLHVRRRHDALAILTEVGQRERERAERRERLRRRTSHEMRTPATIAVGHVELLLAQETDPQKVADLDVVLDELERIILGTERLIRTLSLPEEDSPVRKDLDQMLGEVLDRWRVLADRDWQVDSTAGWQDCSPVRLRVCLDTLLENAVRYTQAGDVVRLVSFVDGNTLNIGVADSGAGLRASFLEWLREDASADADHADVDAKSQTGLGLPLVQEAVGARGGRVAIGPSPEGGALVLMQVPVRARLRGSAAEGLVVHDTVPVALAADALPALQPVQG